MRVFKTATILLAAPLLLTACNKAETTAAEATDNAATVAEMSSSGPGIIPGKSSADGADPDATQTTNTAAPK